MTNQAKKVQDSYNDLVIDHEKGKFIKKQNALIKNHKILFLSGRRSYKRKNPS